MCEAFLCIVAYSKLFHAIFTVGKALTPSTRKAAEKNQEKSATHEKAKDKEESKKEEKLPEGKHEGRSTKKEGG